MNLIGLEIKNFRSIKEQKISSINNALVLVGKNNGGKSSVINSLRVLFGDYQVAEEDFHKDTNEIEIKGTFEVSEQYIKPFIFNTKVGLEKIPSSGSKFNRCKEGTEYEESNFNEYKSLRSSAIEDSETITDLISNNSKIVDFWITALKKEFDVDNNILNVVVKINKDKLKTRYYDKSDNEIKNVTHIFPKIAFINDDRNFEEEETGKTKTLTNDLFGNHILNKGRNSDDLTCDVCTSDNCDDCLDSLREKNIDDLSITDLEKLTRNKLNNLSSDIAKEISKYFANNYKSDYKVSIEPISNIDKSISISTKIFDPNLNRKIELSNIGAGLRSIYILSLLQAYKEINNNKGAIFIIEEPEIYLHPSLQKIMGQILHEISNCNQVFFTTHSPLLLKSFDVENIREVKLNSMYETTIEETTVSQILHELGYNTEDILQTEYTIIVEGKDDIHRLKRIINKYYDIDVDKIFFLDSKNCSNIAIYGTLRFLDKTVMKNNFVIIRDSDTKDIEYLKSDLLNKFRENLGQEFISTISNRIHIHNYSAFENYFLDPDLLVELDVIRSIEDYYSRIDRYVTNNKDDICEYIRRRNKKNPDRAEELIESIYSDYNISDKLEAIKMYVRGHNLFGMFGKLKKKTDEYIDIDDGRSFSEILQFLDNFEYFSDRRILNEGDVKLYEEEVAVTTD